MYQNCSVARVSDHLGMRLGIVSPLLLIRSSGQWMKQELRPVSDFHAGARKCVHSTTKSPPYNSRDYRGVAVNHLKKLVLNHNARHFNSGLCLWL